MFSLNERKQTWTTQKVVQKRSRSIMGVIGMVATGILLFVQVSHPTASAASQNQRYIVQSGDTLWGIASENSFGRDTRDVLDQIENLNALDTSAHIYPGQVLQVPSK